MTSQGQDLRVLYVLGPGRSGTGILGRILSTIDGVAFAGELRRLWSRGLRPGRTCACGRPHAECEVWSKILVPGTPFVEPGRSEIAQLQRRVAPEHLGWRTALRRRGPTSSPPPSTSEGRYVAAYTDLHLAFARAADAEVVVDSSKSAADAVLLAARPGVETSVVQIHRDPRGVAFSLQQHYAKDGGIGRHLLAIRAAARWVAKHLTNEAIRRRYGPDRSIVLRYEDLVEDPRSVVEAVAKLVGRPSPVAELAPGVPIRVPEVHGPDGSKRRRFVTTEVALHLDTRWQEQLHPVDRVLVTLITLPLLRRYGYPIRATRRRPAPARSSRRAAG